MPPPERRATNTYRQNDGRRTNEKEGRPTASLAPLLFEAIGRRTLKAGHLALEESQILELGTASVTGLQVRATVLQSSRRELSIRIGFQIRVREMSD